MCLREVAAQLGPPALRREDSGSTAQEERDAALQKMPVDLIYRSLVSRADYGGYLAREEEVVLQTWDFGGQREYYVMHHLFLTNRGVYLAVLNLELWLWSQLPQRRGVQRHGMEAWMRVPLLLEVSS